MDILLTEEFMFNIKNEFGVYKNPKSIKRMVSKERAISDKNGDLFVIDDPYHFTHRELYIALKLKNEIGNYGKNANKVSPDKLLLWLRLNNTNTFKLSKSYDESTIKEIKNMKLPNLDKVRKKNSQYKFLLEPIW